MRPTRTTPAILEAMAARTGRAIELTRDAAYLTVGRRTWVAPLPAPDFAANIAARWVD